MKYIDADKLIAEIERRRLQNRYIDTDGYEQELFEIITSLQQEQVVMSDTDKSNLHDVPDIIRASNHPFKENLALTLEKYIK